MILCGAWRIIFRAELSLDRLGPQTLHFELAISFLFTLGSANLKSMGLSAFSTRISLLPLPMHEATREVRKRLKGIFDKKLLTSPLLSGATS